MDVQWHTMSTHNRLQYYHSHLLLLLAAPLSLFRVTGSVLQVHWLGGFVNPFLHLHLPHSYPQAGNRVKKRAAAVFHCVPTNPVHCSALRDSTTDGLLPICCC